MPPNFFQGWDHARYPLYLSDIDGQSPWHDRLGHWQLFDSKELKVAQYQLFAGPPMTGAPIHYHLHAMNMILAGRKRWFILPPRDAVYSGTQIHRWFENERESVHSQRRPLECVQEAGDAFYVPMGWAHGVLNLRYTVALAAEFSHTPRGGEAAMLSQLADTGELQQRAAVREYIDERLLRPMYA